MIDTTKRCTQCVHAIKDPNATPEQIIAGVAPSICIAGPPTTFMMATSRGGVLVTCYPSVNKDTLSCHQFQGALS